MPVLRMKGLTALTAVPVRPSCLLGLPPLCFLLDSALLLLLKLVMLPEP